MTSPQAKHLDGIKILNSDMVLELVLVLVLLLVLGASDFLLSFQ